MKFQSLTAAAALALCIAAPAHADTVEGTITKTNSFLGYMGVMTDIHTSPASSLLPESGFVFCIQGYNHWPETGTPRQYTLGDSFAPYLQNPQTADKATAMLNYVVDNYYTPLMQGQFGQQAGYGFNQAVWQLTDFDGTRQSMEAYSGSPDARGSYQLYATIMGDLYSHFDTIAPTYRSSTFNIAYLQDGDTTMQSLALVTPNTGTPSITSAVPEPTSAAMLLAGGCGILLLAQRRKPRA